MVDRKVVLVTGCSGGGIGFSICEKLAGRDCIVYATARSIESMQAFRHAEINRLVLDVTNEDQVQSVVKTIIDNEGRIDIVINNAGILIPGPMVDYTVDQFKAVYDANVFSILRVCQAVIPHMAACKKGLIVNIGSVVGEYPTPWMGAYDSSKGAVRIMTEVLSMECRAFNIRVMLITPGSIQTNIIHKQDGYRLLPGSIYTGYAHNIQERLETARDKHAMPRDDFAEEVVSKIVSQNPPCYILAGGRSWIFRMFPFLPRSWVLSIVWNVFSKPLKQTST